MVRILFLKLNWLKYLLLYILRKGKSPGKESICYTENIHIWELYKTLWKGECKLEPTCMSGNIEQRFFSICFTYLQPNTPIHLQTQAQIHWSKLLWISLQHQWIWPLHIQFYFSSKLKIPLYFKTSLYLSLHPLGPTHRTAVNRLEGL